MCYSPFFRRNLKIDNVYRHIDFIEYQGKRYNPKDYSCILDFNIKHNVLGNLLHYKFELQTSIKNHDSDTVISVKSRALSELCNNIYVSIRGVHMPIYHLCPCNKCLECRSMRSDEIKSLSCLMAYKSSDALFFTLTYDDEHLPSCGLQIQDYTAFTKAFRANVDYYLPIWYSTDLKYHPENVPDFHFKQIYCGEYGKTTHRAHYHGLYFFYNSRRFNDYDRKFLYYVFLKSWNKGIIHKFEFVDKIIGAAFYISKYIVKSFYLDQSTYKNPMFVRQSVIVGKRGLGCIEEIVELCKKSTDGNITLPIDGKPVTFRIPQRIFDYMNPKVRMPYHTKLCDLNSMLSIYLGRLTSDSILFDYYISRYRALIRQFTIYPKTRQSYLPAYHLDDEFKLHCPISRVVFPTWDMYNKWYNYVQEGPITAIEQYTDELLDLLESYVTSNSTNCYIDNQKQRETAREHIYGVTPQLTIYEYGARYAASLKRLKNLIKTKYVLD